MAAFSLFHLLSAIGGFFIFVTIPKYWVWHVILQKISSKVHYSYCMIPVDEFESVSRLQSLKQATSDHIIRFMNYRGKSGDKFADSDVAKETVSWYSQAKENEKINYFVRYSRGEKVEYPPHRPCWNGWSGWYAELGPSDQLKFCGELGYCLHHTVVTISTLFFVFTANISGLLVAYYVEAGGEIADTLLCAFGKTTAEVRPALYKYLLAHHFVSIAIIPLGIVYDANPWIGAQFILSLVGTSILTYVCALLLHTPAHELKAYAYFSWFKSVLIIICRGFIWIYLFYATVSHAFSVGWRIGLFTLLAMSAFSTFNKAVVVHEYKLARRIMKNGWTLLTVPDLRVERSGDVPYNTPSPRIVGIVKSAIPSLATKRKLA